MLIDSHKDTHGHEAVRQMHRFYAPLAIGDDVCTVLLTAKEFEKGHASVDGLRLYHHRLEKKMLPALGIAQK